MCTSDDPRTCHCCFHREWSPEFCEPTCIFESIPGGFPALFELVIRSRTRVPLGDGRFTFEIDGDKIERRLRRAGIPESRWDQLEAMAESFLATLQNLPRNVGFDEKSVAQLRGETSIDGRAKQS